MEVEEAEEAEVGKNRAEEDAVGKNRRPQGASATAHANDSAVHTPPPPASALEGAAQGSSTEMIPSFPSTLDVKELQQLGNANKTQERVDAHAPDLLGGSKRIELIKIKKEQLLGGVERTQEPFHAEDPTNKAGIEKTQVDGAEHDLSQFAEKDDASKKQRLKKNKRKRRELEKINEEQCLGGANKTQLLSSTLRWHASYSILFFDHQRMSKVCEGLILLQTEMKRVFLLQADETFIDFNDLKEGESVHPGSTLEFPCHKVIVGEQIQSDEKKSKCLKRKRLSENREREKELKRVRSPQATLLRSPMGLFARVASSRKGMPPQVKRSKSESPSMPNVTGHFPSPNLPRRRRPRKLKSHIWKDFVPVYEHGRIAQGRCKHCHEVFVASQSSGTNHVRRSACSELS